MGRRLPGVEPGQRHRGRQPRRRAQRAGGQQTAQGGHGEYQPGNGQRHRLDRVLVHPQGPGEDHQQAGQDQQEPQQQGNEPPGATAGSLLDRVRVARRELLDRWRPYKVRPAPGYETGTAQHELLAGFVAAVDYVDSLGWDAIVAIAQR